MTSLERYNWARNTPSDINEHVPTLYLYGRRCSHITEFGVRSGVSTSAWLHAKPSMLVCYDLNEPECLPELKAIANTESITFQFIQADTANVQIEPTECLLIDTLHTAAQVERELANADKVIKYICLHDTVTFGWQGEGATDGILFALMDFLLAHPEWRVLEHHTYNNGLTILGRV